MMTFKKTFILLNLLSSVSLFSCGSSSQDSSSLAAADVLTQEKISFSVASPVVLKGGSPVLISWPFKSLQPQILSVYLSADNGLTWNLIEPYLSNTGTYNFNAPLLNGVQFLIKVTSSADTVPIALSSAFKIDSLGPILNPISFAGPLAISQSEFTTYASFLSGSGSSTWTLDLSTYVIDASDFSVFVLVSASQRGGAVVCAAKVCVYNVPSTTFNNDVFSIYLQDSVGNQTGPIVVSIDPTYVPPAAGGPPPPAGPPPPSPIPTLIPLASITDGGLGATDPFAYCPKTSIDNSLTPVVRICSPGDTWPGCTITSASLDLDGAYINGLASGTRVELVYNGTPAQNTWRACDMNLNVDNLTIVGVCGRPIISGASCNQYGTPFRIQKALFVNNAQSTRFVNLEFTAMNVSAGNGGNGSGIRNQGKNLIISHSYFHDGQEGILDGGQPGGFILVQKSKFQRLGRSGYEHTIYAAAATAHLVVKQSVFARSFQGHELKSRAQQTTVQCSAFTSRRSKNAASSDAQDSYLINLPQGGKALVENSVLSEGTSTTNPALMSYADEGASLSSRNYYQDYTFQNNLIMNYNTTNGYFLLYRQFDASPNNAASTFSFTGNTFAGLGASYVKNKFFNILSGTDLSTDMSVSNILASDPAVQFPTRDANEDLPLPPAGPCPGFSYSWFPN